MLFVPKLLPASDLERYADKKKASSSIDHAK